MEKTVRGRPPKNGPSLVRIQTYIYQPESDRLTAIATASQISMAHLIRRACIEYLERHCQPN